MKQSISAPLAIVVVALVVVVALGIGWYMMNRELKPVPYDANAAHAASADAKGGNGKMRMMGAFQKKGGANRMDQ